MTIISRIKDVANRRAMTSIPRPPGPRNIDALVGLARFMNNPMTFVSDLAAEYGGISYFRLSIPGYFVSDPDIIEDVLVRKSRYFVKDSIINELSSLIGNGLLISEDPLWKRQRKLAAPTFQKKHIANYAETMVAYTEATLDGWEDGSTIDFYAATMDLALRIVVKTLFDVELESETAVIGDAIDAAMNNFHQQVHTAWRFVPRSLPTPGVKRYKAAVEHLDTIIFDLIEKRRGQNDDGNDLLNRLIHAVDDDGHHMSLQQLRDETITMFLAGHETTALALSYAWYLLTKYPETATALYEEVDRVLGDRTATLEDVNQLVYTRAVVQETLRLYPPAWIVGREAVSDVVLGNWLIPKGSQVFTSQWVVHRNAEWFPEPDTFKPERWLDGLEKRLPRFAYFPFGGGPRICIGNHFAMMEAILIVATIAKRFRLTQSPTTAGQPLTLMPAVTMRPTSPIELIVSSR